MAKGKAPSAERAIIAEFWARGDLSYLLRPDGQLRIRNFIEENSKGNEGLSHFVVNAHRRLGKSFLLLLILVERCLRNPWQQCAYGAPTTIQVEEIVRPNLAILLRDCPAYLRPEKSKNRYTFRNPRWGDPDAFSTLRLVGCNVAQGDRLRGTSMDVCALDEVREFEHLRYIIESVLTPQFVGRANPTLIQATTPPKSTYHPFVRHYVHRAEEEGRYICVPGSQNKDFAERDRRMVAEECGGTDTISYRRETECELIADLESLVVPEFPPVREVICVNEYKRPTHFWPIAVMDTGWTDYTAVLFGYVDFEAQLLVIEHTLWTHYRTTGQIADRIRKIEDKLYPQSLLEQMGPHFCVRRYGDMTAQALDDFRRDQRLHFMPVEKYDRDGAIARFRTGVQKKKLRVVNKSGCNTPLIVQLNDGVWNERRTDFERGEGNMGHCDALAAAVYMWRMAAPLFNKNPFPGATFDPRREAVDPTTWGKDDNRMDLKDAFNARASRRPRGA